MSQDILEQYDLVVATYIHDSTTMNPCRDSPLDFQLTGSHDLVHAPWPSALVVMGSEMSEPLKEAPPQFKTILICALCSKQQNVHLPCG